MIKKVVTQRDTRQRAAIRDVFAKFKRPLSPKELLDEASKAIPHLGIATVYRNLKIMVEAGDIIPVEIPGEPDRYALPEDQTRTIFACTLTGRTFFIDDKKASVSLPRTTKDFKFKDYRVFFIGESKK